MSAESARKNWRRWREAVFATCTVWLVLQNLVLFAIVAWGKPTSALAAGAALAHRAATMSGQVLVLALAAVLGLALAAWLVHAPADHERIQEVNHDV
jgi:hypothetical protein